MDLHMGVYNQLCFLVDSAENKGIHIEIYDYTNEYCIIAVYSEEEQMNDFHTIEFSNGKYSHAGIINGEFSVYGFLTVYLIYKLTHKGYTINDLLTVIGRESESECA